ncbi:MAG: acyl-CoA synthetase [Alphaproteobacteria bacterium]
MTSRLLDIRDYAQAQREFSWQGLWDIMDGTPARLNIAHECIDRHPDDAVAARIKFADGRCETYDFATLKSWTSRFAHYLGRQGVERGDCVAVMIEPSLDYLACKFGAMKRGVIVAPLSTLFGAEAILQRVEQCAPKLLIVPPDFDIDLGDTGNMRIIKADAAFRAALEAESDDFTVADTAADDLAFYLFTSGTTRQRAAAIPHQHRAVVTLMLSALYGFGVHPGDRFFSPSSPAYGFGAHTLISPLALGIAVGSLAGQFDPVRVLEALEAFEITNFCAPPTVYRMIMASGRVGDFNIGLEKASYSGEPMDTTTADWVRAAFGVPASSVYGSAEVSTFIGNYPGFTGFEPRRGALGKPFPGREVAILDEKGGIRAPGQTGEIAIRKRGEWVPIKDRGSMDADGYVYHAGRSDDVIISAVYTMSATEMEDVLLRHEDVRDVAVVGVKDTTRGLIPKAFVVGTRRDADFVAELQDFAKERLGKHEYPRVVAFLDILPRTAASKIDRKALRADN